MPWSGVHGVESDREGKLVVEHVTRHPSHITRHISLVTHAHPPHQASQCFEWCRRTCSKLMTSHDHTVSRDSTVVMLMCQANCNMGDLKMMRGDVEGARKCYSFAVDLIEGTFGSKSYNLIRPTMLCAAAHAELGDGEGVCEN